MSIHHDFRLFRFWLKKNVKAIFLPNVITLLAVAGATLLLSLSYSISNPKIDGVAGEQTFYSIYKEDGTSTVGFTLKQIKEIRQISEPLSKAGLVLPISIPIIAPNALKVKINPEVISMNLLEDVGLAFVDNKFDGDLYQQGGVVIDSHLARQIGDIDTIVGKSVRLKTDAGALNVFVAGVSLGFEGYLKGDANLFVAPVLLRRLFNATDVEMNAYMDGFVKNSGFMILPSMSEDDVSSSVFKMNYGSTPWSRGALYSKYISKNLEQIVQVEDSIEKLSNVSVLLFLLVIFSLLRQFFQLRLETLEEQKIKWQLGATGKCEFFLDNMKIAARHVPSAVVLTLIAFVFWVNDLDINISGVLLPVEVSEVIKVAFILHALIHLTYLAINVVFIRVNSATDTLKETQPTIKKTVFTTMFISQMTFCFVLCSVAVGTLISLYSNIPESMELDSALVVSPVDIKRDPSRLKIEAEPFLPIYRLAKGLDVAWASRSPYGGARDSKEYFVDQAMSKSFISDTWSVTEEYFELLNIPLIKGRYGVVGRYGEVVVNESFVESMGIGVGDYFFYRTFSVSVSDAGYQMKETEATPLKVVGVVADANFTSIKYSIEPTIYQFTSSAFEASYAIHKHADGGGITKALAGKVQLGNGVSIVELYDNDMAFIRFTVVTCALAITLAFLVNYTSVQGSINEYIQGKLPIMRVKIAIGSTPADSAFELVHMLNILVGISMLIGLLLLMIMGAFSFLGVSLSMVETFLSSLLLMGFYVCSCVSPLKNMLNTLEI